MNIEKANEKYCLHDCVINRIEIKDSTLILYADKGIYEFDVNIGTYKIRENCNIVIKIDGLNEKESYEHISVYLFKKNVRKDISFNKFCEMIKNNNFKIYLDFYSNFAHGLLLKGFCGKYEIELLITEVNDIKFIFTK